MKYYAFIMFFYTIGCQAALEKLAFGPADAEKVLKAIEPYVKRVPGAMPEAASPHVTRVTAREMLSQMPERYRAQVEPGLRRTVADAGKGLGTITLPRIDDTAAAIGRQSAVAGEPNVLHSLALKMRPEERRMTAAIVGGHEMDELLLSRYLRPTRTNPYQVYGHMSPRVVTREHARVATLPPDYDVARKFQQAMRNKSHGEALPGVPIPTEASLLEQATRGVGGRPGITYGAPGTRLSRHAQKRVSLRIQEMVDKLRQQVEAAGG